MARSGRPWSSSTSAAKPRASAPGCDLTSTCRETRLEVIPAAAAVVPSDRPSATSTFGGIARIGSTLPAWARATNIATYENRTTIDQTRPWKRDELYLPSTPTAIFQNRHEPVPIRKPSHRTPRTSAAPRYGSISLTTCTALSNRAGGCTDQTTGPSRERLKGRPTDWPENPFGIVARPAIRYGCLALGHDFVARRVAQTPPSAVRRSQVASRQPSHARRLCNDPVSS